MRLFSPISDRWILFCYRPVSVGTGAGESARIAFQAATVNSLLSQKFNLATALFSDTPTGWQLGICSVDRIVCITERCA
jgi:hypothetical protein